MSSRRSWTSTRGYQPASLFVTVDEKIAVIEVVEVVEVEVGGVEGVPPN